MKGMCLPPQGCRCSVPTCPTSTVSMSDAQKAIIITIIMIMICIKIEVVVPTALLNRKPRPQCRGCGIGPAPWPRSRGPDVLKRRHAFFARTHVRACVYAYMLQCAYRTRNSTVHPIILPACKNLNRYYKLHILDACFAAVTSMGHTRQTRNCLYLLTRVPRSEVMPHRNPNMRSYALSQLLYYVVLIM